MSRFAKFIMYLGYSETPCPECGRLRVEAWSDGYEECEKCNWSNDPYRVLKPWEEMHNEDDNLS